MQTMSVPQAPTNVDSVMWESYFWDEVLAYIEERRVIPIVGGDLLQVEVDGRKTLLDHYVARQLAARFSLPVDQCEEEPTLNRVICELLSTRRREALYVAIRDIMKSAAFATPEPLRQLAEIRDFQLFVSTTFDSLLEQALNEVRFNGRPQTESISYAPNNIQDLDPGRHGSRTLVYHLLGKLSTAPSYVICDEDLLEFVSALQSESRRPERLFDELKENHLLILGEGFPDWLARFFLRATRQNRLLDRRDVLEVLADSRTQRDRSLVLFLRHFSSPTRVFQGGGAVEFVDELWRRWKERNVSPDGEEKVRTTPPPADMPFGAIFISYAREDLPAVQQLKAGLEAAGLTVWFDFDQLAAGDAFDMRIKNNIRNCSLFVPVLSKNTEARHEGYFRREWHLALDRAMNIDPGAPFIIPVVVDGTEKFYRAPEAFLKLHLTRLEDGRVTPEFAARLEQLCQ
jgi:hypothetical protein